MPRTPPCHQNTEAKQRDKRLAQALRANLQRRKNQKRGRDTDSPKKPSSKDTD